MFEIHISYFEESGIAPDEFKEVKEFTFIDNMWLRLKFEGRYLFIKSKPIEYFNVYLMKDESTEVE